jgi:hypothetical protein
MVLGIGHSGNQIRNTLKVLKCGSRGWRTSFGLIVRKMKKYHRMWNISTIWEDDNK